VKLNKEILRHSAIYSGAGVLEKIVSFMLLPFYAHIFETAGYGVIGMIDVTVGVLSIALYSGYYNAILTTYHAEPARSQGRVISTAVLLQGGFALLAVPLPMLLSPWLSSLLFGDARYHVLIILALASLAADLTGKTASSELLIRGQSVTYSIIALLRMVVVISLNIFLVLVLHVGLLGIFISSLVSTSVSASIFIFIALRRNGIAFDRDIARRLLKFQLPLVPAELVAFFARQAERLLVRFTINLQGVGILEMAYKFPPLLNWLVVSPFMMAWRTKSLEIGNHPDAPKAMGRMLTNLIFVLLLGGTIMAVDMKPLLMLLTPEEFWPAASIARVEVVTTIFAGLVIFMQFGLIYRKRTGRLAVIRTSAAVSKTAVSVFLISRYGLRGAAYSALMMEAVTLIWLFKESQHAYRIHVEIGRIALLTGTAAALWAGITYAEQLPWYPSSQVANGVVPVVRHFLEATPIAQWKSGKVIALLTDKSGPLASMLINTAAASTFALLVFVVRPNTRRSMRSQTGAGAPELLVPIDTTTPVTAVAGPVDAAEARQG
jgi:O-antigen/teichoic acid export membrane protein